ncbi:MAG: hypothetical protein ACE5J7_02945 [Candidatus Aenigmatarchaeota archaeon]
MSASSEWLIPHPNYSEDGTYVFQNIELREAIREFPALFAYFPLKEGLPKLLEKTEAHYKSEKVGAQNQNWYKDAISFTRAAKEDYEAGHAKIIMFYGNYQDKDRRLVLVFEK